MPEDSVSMEIKFRLGTSVEANGTSFVGYAQKQTLANLTSKLGEPRFLSESEGDGKVTCEWVIVGEDGTVATVYDWKMGATPVGEHDWHIGGRSSRAVSLIHSILNK